MFVRVIMLVLAICTLIGTSVQAQTEPFGTAVLRAVTVTIISRNYATRQGGICHGAVYTVINSVAYVTTAKHCVETLSSAPLSPGTQWRDIHEVVTVKFPNGATGHVVGIFWPRDYDALVMKTKYSPLFHGEPVGWLQVCRCGYYRTFGHSTRISILSMLSAGGGAPVPTDGYVITDSTGRPTVLLSTAHGTSGTLVVDRQGRMIGLVWGVYSSAGEGGASFRAAITPAAVVIGLVKYALENDGVGQHP